MAHKRVTPEQQNYKQYKVDDEKWYRDQLNEALNKYTKNAVEKAKIEEEMEKEKQVIFNILKELGLVKKGKNFETTIGENNVVVYTYDKDEIKDSNKYYEYIESHNLNPKDFTIPSLWYALKRAKDDPLYQNVLRYMEDNGITEKKEVNAIAVHGKKDSLKDALKGTERQ